MKKDEQTMKSIQQVLKEIRSGTVHPVYLLHGTENYFIEQFKQTLLEQVLVETNEEFSQYDLKEVSIQDVIIDVETLPFFQDKKIVFTYNPTFLATTNEKTKVNHAVERLEVYLENPVPYSTLVIVAPYEKLDGRKKVTKTLKRHAVLVNCEPISEKDIRKWIAYLMRQHGLTFTEDAIFLLESEFGANLYLLEREIEKLKLYVEEETEVTHKIVSEIIAPSPSHSALELVDAVLKNDLHEAMKIYDLLEKNREDPIGLIALLAFQFRTLLQVKLLQSKGHSLQSMQQSIQVHPYVVQLAVKRTKHFTEAQLVQIIDTLTETDTKVKRGLMDKYRAFEMLLYTLVTS